MTETPPTATPADYLRILIGGDLMDRIGPVDVARYRTSGGDLVIRFRIGDDPLLRCMAIARRPGHDGGRVTVANQLDNDTGDDDQQPRFLIHFGKGADFAAADGIPGAVQTLLDRIGAPTHKGGW